MFERGAWALILWLGAGPLSGCDGCRRTEPPPSRKSQAPEPAAECTTANDCADDDPCAEADCVDERCVFSPVPAGEACGPGTACDGVPECDGQGRCVPGVPPVIDDGNACTIDACDPVRGVTHQPVKIDDSDACTIDACDPLTGEITHAPVVLDDGDDCTFDSCDHERGVSHRRADPYYTCEPSCGSGFHAASRTESSDCPSGVRSYCTPDCGPSFHACGRECPDRYRKISESASSQCGPNLPVLSSCVRQ